MQSLPQTFPTIVRVRPALPREEVAKMRVTDHEVKITDENHYFTQSVPLLLPATASQQDVFRCVSPSISRVCKGYNAAVIAYGETGSGKTFSMFGREDGIVPQAIEQLYRELSPHLGRGRHYVVLVSSVLVYNEKMYDLLESNPLMSEVIVREYNGSSITIEGLSEMIAADATNCKEIVQRSLRGRDIVSAQLPVSHSHSILHLRVESQKVCRHGALRKSRLTFCDMAGCEVALLKSADTLHQSLKTFNSVISMLASGSAPTSLPYRESKLTTLLQHALQQSSNSCFLFTISPALRSIETTIETLKKVSKSAMIKLVPVKKNIQVDAEFIESLRFEVDVLRESLEGPRSCQRTVLAKKRTTEMEEVEEHLQELHGFKLKLQESTIQNSHFTIPQREISQEKIADNLETNKFQNLAQQLAESPAIPKRRAAYPQSRPILAASYAQVGMRSSVSPVLSSTEQASVNPSQVRGNHSLDLSFDQLVMQTNRSRNDRRTQHQASFRRAVEDTRKLNVTQSEAIVSDKPAEQEDDISVLVQEQLKRFQEEREANRRKLELKIQKEKEDREAFSKKLSRRPAIEPRPLRPKGAADRLRKLLE